MLARATSSIEMPCRSARAGSSAWIRRVAIRPGRMMLTVTTSAATSRASVVDQPTRESRSAFEMPRFGIGATTPELVLVKIRPPAALEHRRQDQIGEADHSEHHRPELRRPELGIVAGRRSRRRPAGVVDEYLHRP